MITMEFVVLGNYMVQGESMAECRQQLDDTMNDIFLDYTAKEVK